MSKSNSSIISMVLTLFVITLVASTSLAFINELTKDRIKMVKLEKKLSAIREVIPEHDNNPQEEMFKLASDLDSLECYPAKRNGQLVGIAIESYTIKGFSGEFRLMIGFKPEGLIHNIMVIDHNETPGLGTEMKKPKFKNQYIGSNPAEIDIRVKKDGGDIDAITAATISSRAFSDAVQRAFNAWQKGENK